MCFLAFQVWMNELEKEYDQDTYHISQTQSVLLRLEGHTLRLSTPRRNIPKRTMWDEEMPKPEFVYQRIFDMRGAEVNLRPEGLVQKRLWSKKYPIFIDLPTKGKSRTKRDVQTAFNDETFTDCGDFEVIKDGECEDQQLILFARTGREKEEWFWRFEVAVKHDKVRGRKPIPTLYKKVSMNNNEYRNENGELHHVKSDTYNPLAKKGMVDFYKFIAKVLPRNKDLKEVSIAPVNVKASGVTYASPTPKEKKSSLEAVGVTLDTPLAWANALIGRIFWDFLREEYWAGVVQTKLQKKLDKLRVSIKSQKSRDSVFFISNDGSSVILKEYCSKSGLDVHTQLFQNKMTHKIFISETVHKYFHIKYKFDVNSWGLVVG